MGISQFLGQQYRLSSGKYLPEALKNASSAELWVQNTIDKFGQSELSIRVIELLKEISWSHESELTANINCLDALICLNEMTQIPHMLEGLQLLSHNNFPYNTQKNNSYVFFDYALMFESAYSAFLQGKVVNTVHKPKVALIFALRLYYLSEIQLWQMSNYFVLQDSFWKKVNETYIYSESLELENIPVYLFDDSSFATTIQDEFLTVMMLGKLSGGNLTVKEIYTAYKLLCILSTHIEICKQYDISSSFCIDLKGSSVARRTFKMVRDDFDVEAFRYWNTTDLVIALSDCTIDIESGRIPEQLQEDFVVMPDTTFLRLLCREWAPQPLPISRDPRFSVQEYPIAVVHYLPAIHYQLLNASKVSLSGREVLSTGFGNHYSEKIKSKFYENSHNQIKEWIIRDESASGLGIQIDPHDMSWVKISSIFAFRNQEQSEDNKWSLAIVRRIRRFSEHEVFIGVSKLSSQVIPVTLRTLNNMLPDKTMPIEWSWMNGLIALYMPAKSTGEILNDCLVMPLGLYLKKRAFLLLGNGKTSSIQLLRIIERGKDWCLVEFERLPPNPS